MDKRLGLIMVAAMSGRADLRGTYLRGAYLGGADLRGADLRGADLRGADLGGAYLGDGLKPVTRIAGRATRSDGYEFLMWQLEEGHIIRAGCRTFTLTEFRAHVASEYPDSPKAAETLSILDYLERSLTLEAWD